MAEYISAPSCSIEFTGPTELTSMAVVESVQGQMQVNIEYFDGGSGNRYAFVGEVQGKVTFTDLKVTSYTSGSATAADRTTDDILPTSTNTSYAIDINYGTKTLISLSKCTSEFDYKALASKGPALLLQGVFPYRIWDPN